MFIRLVKKCFSSNPSLKSQHNTSTIEIYYSAARNIGSYISSHNMEILHPIEKNRIPCNCIRMPYPVPECNIENNCRVKETVYQATINSVKDQDRVIRSKNYIGSTEQQLKDRVSFHRSCMRLNNLRNSCELSKEAHRLADEHQRFNVTWKILEKSSKIRPGDDFCKLCISEMYHTVFRRNGDTLNSLKLEACLHKAKTMLGSVT